MLTWPGSDAAQFAAELDGTISVPFAHSGTVEQLSQLLVNDWAFPFGTDDCSSPEDAGMARPIKNATLGYSRFGMVD